jgi:hypothetical protein
MVANVDLSDFSEEERRDIQAELDEGFADIEQRCVLTGTSRASGDGKVDTTSSSEQ